MLWPRSDSSLSPPRHPLTLAVLLALSGCSASPTGPSPTPYTPPDCEAPRTPQERDLCLSTEINQQSDAEQVQSLAARIQDPVIRQAAVSAWLDGHLSTISEPQARTLCALLEGQDAQYCVRRLSTPHLRR